MQDSDRADAAIVAEIAAEIYAFVQRFPNHYAAAGLAALVNREVAGETVADDERELVLLTLVREAKANARNQRFGRSARHPNSVDENA